MEHLLKLYEYFFSSFWVWLGTLAFLLVLTGEIRRLGGSIKKFIAATKARYDAKIRSRNSLV
jgi:hypothetical protein